METLIPVLALVVVIVLVIAKAAAVIVPQQNAFIVEKLGKYSRTLTTAGSDRSPAGRRA